MSIRRDSTYMSLRDVEGERLERNRSLTSSPRESSWPGIDDAGLWTNGLWKNSSVPHNSVGSAHPPPMGGTVQKNASSMHDNGNAFGGSTGGGNMPDPKEHGNSMNPGSVISANNLFDDTESVPESSCTLGYNDLNFQDHLERHFLGLHSHGTDEEDRFMGQLRSPLNGRRHSGAMQNPESRKAKNHNAVTANTATSSWKRSDRTPKSCGGKGNNYCAINTANSDANETIPGRFLRETLSNSVLKESMLKLTAVSSKRDSVDVDSLDAGNLKFNIGSMIKNDSGLFHVLSSTGSPSKTDSKNSKSGSANSKNSKFHSKEIHSLRGSKHTRENIFNLQSKHTDGILEQNDKGITDSINRGMSHSNGGNVKECHEKNGNVISNDSTLESSESGETGNLESDTDSEKDLMDIMKTMLMRRLSLLNLPTNRPSSTTENPIQNEKPSTTMRNLARSCIPHTQSCMPSLELFSPRLREAFSPRLRGLLAVGPVEEKTEVSTKKPELSTSDSNEHCTNTSSDFPRTKWKGGKRPRNFSDGLLLGKVENNSIGKPRRRYSYTPDGAPLVGILKKRRDHLEDAGSLSDSRSNRSLNRSPNRSPNQSSHSSKDSLKFSSNLASHSLQGVTSSKSKSSSQGVISSDPAKTESKTSLKTENSKGSVVASKNSFRSSNFESTKGFRGLNFSSSARVSDRSKASASWTSPRSVFSLPLSGIFSNLKDSVLGSQKSAGSEHSSPRRYSISAISDRSVVSVRDEASVVSISVDEDHGVDHHSIRHGVFKKKLSTLERNVLRKERSSSERREREKKKKSKEMEAWWHHHGCHHGCHHNNRNHGNPTLIKPEGSAREASSARERLEINDLEISHAISENTIDQTDIRNQNSENVFQTRSMRGALRMSENILENAQSKNKAENLANELRLLLAEGLTGKERRREREEETKQQRLKQERMKLQHIKSEKQLREIENHSENHTGMDDIERFGRPTEIQRVGCSDRPTGIERVEERREGDKSIERVEASDRPTEIERLEERRDSTDRLNSTEIARLDRLNLREIDFEIEKLEQENLKLELLEQKKLQLLVRRKSEQNEVRDSEDQNKDRLNNVHEKTDREHIDELQKTERKHPDEDGEMKDREHWEMMHQTISELVEQKKDRQKRRRAERKQQLERESVNDLAEQLSAKLVAYQIGLELKGLQR